MNPLGETSLIFEETDLIHHKISHPPTPEMACIEERKGLFYNCTGVLSLGCATLSIKSQTNVRHVSVYVYNTETLINHRGF